MTYEEHLNLGILGNTKMFLTDASIFGASVMGMLAETVVAVRSGGVEKIHSLVNEWNATDIGSNKNDKKSVEV